VSAPLLPLDALVGYTVTTLDSITYTLTPTKGTAPMDEQTASNAPAWYSADEASAWANGYNAAAEAVARDETCPRCHFHGGYHAEDCDQLEDEPNPDDQFQSRAEWREVPQ